jgi:hypothetical protein
LEPRRDVFLVPDAPGSYAGASLLAMLLLLGAFGLATGQVDVLPAASAWVAGPIGAALLAFVAWSWHVGGERWILEETQPGHLVLKQEGVVGGTTRYLYAQTTQRLELRHAMRQVKGGSYEVLELWIYTDDGQPSRLMETPSVGGRGPVRAIAEVLAARLGRPLRGA